MKFIIGFMTIVYYTIRDSLKILLPIIIIPIVIKIIYRYHKYGKVEFAVFKKKTVIPKIDMILPMINNIEGYHKVIKNNKNIYADLIVIDKSGVYLLKVISYNGSIEGIKEDKILLNKSNNKNANKIENPFYYLNSDIIKLSKIIDINKIKTLIINNSSNCFINIKNASQDEVVNINNFYYTINKRFTKDNILTEEEIDNIYKIILTI